MAEITFTHPDINSGAPIRIFGTSVLFGNKRNVKATANANIDGPVEVQTLAFENRKISIQGVHFDKSRTTLALADLETLLQSKYDGTNAGYLTVSYGKGKTPSGGASVTPATTVSLSFTAPADGYIRSVIAAVDSGSGQNYQVNIKETLVTRATKEIAVAAGETTMAASFVEGDYSSTFTKGDSVTIEIIASAGNINSINWSWSGASESFATSQTGEVNIPVILESYSHPISTAESAGGYIPVGTLSFVETA